MNLAGMEIVGRSLSGLSTCLVLPAEKLVLDIGHPVMDAVRCGTVLISHAHADHIGALAWHCSLRELLHMQAPTYVVPPEIVDDLGAFFTAWRKLDGSSFPCKIVPLESGKRLPVGKGLEVQAFKTPHRVVPSQGYALIRTTAKLRPEFVGIEGAKIGELKRSGIPVTDDVETIELAWTSDSMITVLDQNPWLFQAKRLILEATFLTDENSLEEAHLKGHTHLKEIIANADRFINQQAILLSHYSGRYSADQVVEAMTQLPDGLRERVQILTGGMQG